MKGKAGTLDAKWIDRDEEGALGVGDRVELKTGEILMVTAVCSVTYAMKSITGRGTAMMTMVELDAVIARVL